MDFRELLEKRRAIRDFEDKEVPIDLIREIIDDSIKAPNASNLQPWSFIIINNREVIRRISDSSKKSLLTKIHENPDSPMKVYAEALSDESFNVFYSAPCLILVVGPDDDTLSIRGASLDIDCALLSCYFMFSATSRGLGTCWVALGAQLDDTALLKEIGMPEGYRIHSPLILGYPKSIPPIMDRNEPRILNIVS